MSRASIVLEREWWGDCTNTADEEAKQLKYAELMGLDSMRVDGSGWFSAPFDLGGRSVLDIGGGPVSLLLKCRNRGDCAVLDPIRWPDWVHERYEAAGISYLQCRAESAHLSQVYDEVWIYNVLQHVQDPQKVIEVAIAHGRAVRVFEWLGGEPNAMHPNVMTREFLDGALGVEGVVHTVDWERYLPMVYTAVVKKQSFRFHLLGLAHVPTNWEISSCAYTQKVLKLAKMLESLGHEVVFYGGEGSDVECDEFVQVITDSQRKATYGDYDWRTEFFKHDGNDAAYQTFNENALAVIKASQRAGDFLLCSMGTYQKPIADGLPGIRVIESGVGYRGVFAKFRVFESYAWMHYIYGLLRQNDGSWYDAVIPNYFDPIDFPFEPDKGDYALYIGRIVRRKGVDVAVQVTRELGIPLKMAGQGWLENDVEGLNIRGDHVEFLGTMGPEERKALVGRARFVLVPTYYIEPFGGVAVEAQMCGTPVLTTDWGAFSETVLHGVTGYRCRTFDDFLWAARHIETIDPEKCRRWAVDNYSMDRVKHMYHEYFSKIDDLARDGWYEQHLGRSGLDWLKKEYPCG